MNDTTDRALLEAAARAAGIKIDKSPYNGGGHGNTGFDMLGNAVLDWHNGEKWNPLTDDGDALRLAVKLGFIVNCPVRQDGRDCAAVSRGSLLAQENGDPYAATRRAIVRAAAAVATQTPDGTGRID